VPRFQTQKRANRQRDRHRSQQALDDRALGVSRIVLSALTGSGRKKSTQNSQIRISMLAEALGREFLV
jgi:hypothetical protein